MNTSRKAMEWIICFSIGNVMLGCLLFKKFKKFTGSCSLSKAARMSSVYLKACVHYFLSNFYFSPNDSPSKTMKNAFYFI